MDPMEKQEYSQLELFNKTTEDSGSAQKLSGTLVSYIRTYERLVLMLIGIVITGVVCFCLGVEKGKHIAMSRTNSNLDLAHRNPGTVLESAPRTEAPARSAMPARPTAPAGVAAMPLTASAGTGIQAVRAPVSAAATAVKPDPAAQPSSATVQGYTIQIASYAGKTSAQREMDTLKKQGLLPVIKSSGNYTVLCVGNFPDKATAKSLLTQLKKKYRDCYIRRL